MREFVFRFWNKNTKQFEYDNLDSKATYQNPFKRDDLIPNQWTGLRDKNNIRIYEGDIVRAVHMRVGKIEKIYGADTNDENEELAVIKWRVSEFYIAGAIESVNLGSILEKEIEVIGNIYENPELVKGE